MDEEALSLSANRPWSVSRLTMRKIKSVGYYVLAWMGLSSLFLCIRFLGKSGMEWELLLALCLQFSLLAGLGQGVYEVVVLQDQRMGRSLIISTISRTLALLLLLLLVSAIVIASWLPFGGADVLNHPWQLFYNPDLQAFWIFAFMVGNLVTFTRSVHKKFGTRVLINTLLGKSQDPTEEERIFMFIDLRSATRLAEELGNVAYSAFLRDYFRLLSNCCAENQGEVYQFAGDGVYLSWPMNRCRKVPHPIYCFHDLVICFQRTRKSFERKYGSYPEFKAAIHSGRVIATEVGNYGSEMAYHGDPLNTTARLQSLCNLLKRDLLMTETLLRKLPHTAGFKVEEHGGFLLKGKLHELEVYSIDVNHRKSS